MMSAAIRDELDEWELHQQMLLAASNPQFLTNVAVTTLPIKDMGLHTVERICQP